MERNNNSNKNIKLQIKSFLKKVSLQLYFKRVNVPTVSKARWQSIPYCWSSMEKGSIAKSIFRLVIITKLHLRNIYKYV